MDRATFLKSHWRPFPPAEAHWMDVATYKRSPTRAWVGGRLEGDSSTGWRLTSAGEAIAIRSVDEAILRAGDLAAFEVNGNGLVLDFILLVPSNGHRPQCPGSFDIARWMKFIHTVREFFVERDFLEALTPTLVPSPGTEPFLDPFATDWEMGSRREKVYLPTSPEFHLKKLLASGWTRIFEIKTCFRNGEIGDHHQPEFQMLEWYRAYSGLDAIADDVDGLIATLVAKFVEKLDSDVASAAGPVTCDRTTISELFAKNFRGFELKPVTTLRELRALAEREGVRFGESDSWDEVFFRLFLEKIEPGLGLQRPLLVRGYPPSQAALSRIGTDGFADRFEVYWRGLEIANAFHELNDPSENAARFAADAVQRKALGKPPVPADAELQRWLDYGLPPSGGIALGLDRLFMALWNVETIAETRAFPRF